MNQRKGRDGLTNLIFTVIVDRFQLMSLLDELV